MNTIFTMITLGLYDVYNQSKIDDTTVKSLAAISKYTDDFIDAQKKIIDENDKFLKNIVNVRKGNNEIRASISTM